LTKIITPDILLLVNNPSNEKRKQSMLSHFQLAKFSFNLKAQEPIHLPSYKGSTFRGAFGHTFKKIVCACRSETCDNCPLKEKCIYSYVSDLPMPRTA